MRSFIYPYKSSGVMQEKLALSCASAVLLALLSLPHASTQAQPVTGTTGVEIQPIVQQDLTSIAQDKYQKLIDAGIFSASSGTSSSTLDADLTRAQFAAIAAKIQSLETKTGSTQFADINPAFSSASVAAQLGVIEGVSSGTQSADDKKSAATLAELFTALSKSGTLSQVELDQLLVKVGMGGDGTAKTGESQKTSTATNDDAIRAANNAAANIINSAPDGAATTAGVAGVSAGSLASLALTLATTVAVATSSSANEIALANAAKLGANYTVTPLSNWPANLNATYNGRLSGALSDSSAVGGNLTMNVNFATIRSAGAIPGSVLFDNGKGSASLNLVQFNGFVGGGMNGTYNGQAMTGFIRNGQFYGPAAEALKGSWDMSTSSVSGGGTFVANR